MNQDDSAADLAGHLRLILEHIWPAGRTAEACESTDGLAALWQELCDNEIASLERPAELAAVASELGRAGAAVPLLGAAIARRLLTGSAEQELAAQIANGSARIAVAFAGLEPGPPRPSLAIEGGTLTGRVGGIEDWALATHALVLPGEGERAFLVAHDAPGLAAEPTPGLAVPALTCLTLTAVAGKPLPLHSGAAGQLADLARLLLIARAAGAARRGLELATDYVQVREQFGQPIGRFQALQHKLADCLVAIDVTELLIANAAAAQEAGSGEFETAALSAFASPALRRASLELHHSFGAIGYSEEHELPRHFRRIHADTVRLGGAPASRLSLGRRLLAGGGFPPLMASDGAEAVRGEVNDWLEASWTADKRAAASARPFRERDADPEFVRAAGEKGWLAVNWPRAQGGREFGPLEQLAFVEETERAGAPLAISRAGSWIIGPTLIRHGSDAQRKAYLPGIAAGEIRFCLGYSEPQAGSDLASLRTRAVRDGEDYVIDGQKMWATLAETATHIFVAARTDPEAKPKHAGISLFIVPTDSAGVEIRPGLALYGRSFSTIFLDEVRVPAANLVGPLNGGWAVLTSALASERILMGGQVARMRRLLEELAASLEPRAGDDVVADRIGALAADLQGARLLSLRPVELLEQGASATIEGAISKLFTGDLAERLGETALELLGTAGTFGEEAPGAPLDGAVEQFLRYSIMTVIGGGTAEIQRSLIAQRSLGLPR